MNTEVRPSCLGRTFVYDSYRTGAGCGGFAPNLPILVELKDDVVRMRIPAEHKQALVDAAGLEGLDLSQWLHQLALRAAGVLPAPRKGG